MDSIILTLALGVGALYVAKRGRRSMKVAIGWTARQGGLLASHVASSIDEARMLARQQYERGRLEGNADPIVFHPTNSAPQT